MGAETPAGQISTDTHTAPAFDRTIDWVIGAVLGLVGVLVALGGATLHSVTTQATVADLVRESEFQSEVLTEAEAVDALVALGQWGGIGFVAVGGLLVVLGVGVVIAHARARNHDRGTPRWILGVVGALIGAVLSFVPLSPALGGGAVGYLDPDPDRNGLGTGALAGVFGSLPLLLVGVFAGVGLLVGVPGEAATVAAALLAFAGLFALAYFVGVSAVGGYLGAMLRDR
jgi:hypothetical protein